jgi:oligopeptide/dipeptide ABC transporter ATP-binding protein
MLSLMRLLPQNGKMTSGQIHFLNQDLLALSEAQMTALRWQQIAIVFQGAMNALNPVRTNGDQIGEPLQVHLGLKDQAKRRSRIDELLDLVGINPARSSEYPHQYSGGMRQRAMIAMALACNPQVLIADEPTTALDVMIQAQILELLGRLRHQFGLSVILVTHDLGVVAELCDRVQVLYSGMSAEVAPVDQLYNDPQHPYTQLLLQAFPDLNRPQAGLVAIPGYPPRIDSLPAGCLFAPRCPMAFDRCHQERPAPHAFAIDHSAACHLLEPTA